MMAKYKNLNRARYELTQYLNGLGKYDPTRSIIERSLKRIKLEIASNPTIKACTPEPGYVDQVLKETRRY